MPKRNKDYTLYPGVYQHYENKKCYYVDAIPAVGKRALVQNSIVIYYALNPEPQEQIKFATTLREFQEEVIHEGATVCRFTYCGATVPKTQ